MHTVSGHFVLLDMDGTEASIKVWRRLYDGDQRMQQIFTKIEEMRWPCEDGHLIAVIGRTEFDYASELAVKN